MNRNTTFIPHPKCGWRVKTALRQFEAGHASKLAVWPALFVGLVASMLASTSVSYGFGNGVPSTFRLVTHLALGVGVGVGLGLWAEKAIKLWTRRTLEAALAYDKVICFEDDAMLAVWRNTLKATNMSHREAQLIAWLSPADYEKLVMLSRSVWSPESNSREALKPLITLIGAFKKAHATEGEAPPATIGS